MLIFLARCVLHLLLICMQMHLCNSSYMLVGSEENAGVLVFLPGSSVSCVCVCVCVYECVYIYIYLYINALHM